MHKRTARWGNQSYLIIPVLRKAYATILVLFLIALIVTTPIADGGETNDFIVYVSNERSGNVTVLNGATDTVITTIAVGKRPRGIHCSPNGSLVYVALSGSPRMGPGVDRSRAVADRRSTIRRACR